MMDRRRFATAVALGLLAAPLASAAQQAVKVPRIGILAPGRPLPHPVFEALRNGLRELGYVEGKTIAIEWRWEEDKPDRYPVLARDLAQLSVDIIVAGTTAASVAAKNVTSAIPVVMAATGGDPVEMGLVKSLARPGGNITGLVLLTEELPGKRLELLREAIPGLTRVALLWYPLPYGRAHVNLHETAARSLGIELHRVEVHGPDDFESAFRSATRARTQAAILTQSSLYNIYRARLAELALQSRLPTISGETGYAQAGGLMNYGPNIPDSWRRVAGYVDKILKGAKPADLPIERPTKFEFAINLRTARALGLTISQTLLLRADDIVQ
jgi:putative ABC transport system substrate-binding protein